MTPPLLTLRETARLLHSKEGEIEISLDLGKTKSKVTVKSGIAHFPSGAEVSLLALKKIKDDTIYFLEGNEIKQVALFSDETNYYYKLIPTSDWPTLTLSSTPMHRHTRISPKTHASLMVEEISPIKGKVLDTCTGLGYTAILSSKEAEKVMTFDRDPNVQLMAEYNPYSEELFTSKKIEFTHDDIFDGIKSLKDEDFDRIIHDPPTLKYAPHLYSSEFHRQLFRVLRKGGMLFHYCSNPKKTHGDLLYPRIISQLKESGFQDVVYHEKSSGIKAVKWV